MWRTNSNFEREVHLQMVVYFRIEMGVSNLFAGLGCEQRSLNGVICVVIN